MAIIFRNRKGVRQGEFQFHMTRIRWLDRNSFGESENLMTPREPRESEEPIHCGSWIFYGSQIDVFLPDEKKRLYAGVNLVRDLSRDRKKSGFYRKTGTWRACIRSSRNLDENDSWSRDIVYLIAPNQRINQQTTFSNKTLRKWVRYDERWDSRYSHLNRIERRNNLCIRCKMIIYIINMTRFISIKITCEIACKLKFQS